VLVGEVETDRLVFVLETAADRFVFRGRAGIRIAASGAETDAFFVAAKLRVYL
jgi:hypothetical protein